MKRMTAAATLLVLGICLIPIQPAAVRASANSAPAYWSGASGSGPMLSGPCPIEVTEEKLHLEIPDLPSTSYVSEAQLASYRASVTAEYTFYNPTEEELEVRLAFPFGSRPSYIAAELDDTARFTVTVDGAAVERSVRYTREDYYSYDVSKLLDERRTDSFYSPELPVTVYSLTGLPTGCSVQLDLFYNASRTAIGADGYASLYEGNERLVLYEDGAGNASFTVFGELPEIVDTHYFAENGYGSERPIAAPNADMGIGEAVSLAAALDEVCPDGIGKVDFFNAAVQELERSPSALDRLVYFLTPETMQRWFVYTLTVPAKGSVANTVSAPLYPDISGENYYFEYLLSPASKWADFGRIEITMDTPYTLASCSLPFGAHDGRYTYTKEGLPLGELTFSLTTGQLEYNMGSFNFGILLLLLPLGIRLAFGFVAALVALVVCLATRKRKK